MSTELSKQYSLSYISSILHYSDFPKKNSIMNDGYRMNVGALSLKP